jgi:hypothetical protein
MARPRWWFAWRQTAFGPMGTSEPETITCARPDSMPQIRESAVRRVLEYQQLECVFIQDREYPRRRSRQNVSLCGSQLRMPVVQHLQVLDCPTGLQKRDPNFWIMPLDNRFQGVAQDVALPAGDPAASAKY